MNCPQCNGTGKITLTVTTYGEKGSRSTRLTCPTCNGTGTVTKEQMKAYQAEQEMWCDCGNPSGQTRHYADGQHRVVNKHHYRCADCGKVTQIG